MNKTTQPIKSRKKVEIILNYLKGKNYRDYMLAKIQLNTARRISDIVALKVSHFFNSNMKIREHISLKEKKTNKISIIKINKSLENSLFEYIKDKSLNYDDYLFQSRKGENKHISTTQAHRIFQALSTELELTDFGSHSLRKTWGYFCYKETKNIALIMQVYNHTSEKITLKYLGITQSDIDNIYMSTEF